MSLTSPSRKRSSLESEVIIAVIILYMLISGALLALHYWRAQEEARQAVPARQEAGARE